MEYAKDDIFQIRYNTKLDRLQMKGEGWTRKLHNKIKKHKLLTTTIVAFLMFSCINIFMIYNFMKILENI